VPPDRVEDIDHAGGERVAADLAWQWRVVGLKPGHEGAALVVVVTRRCVGGRVRVGRGRGKGDGEHLAGCARIGLGCVGQPDRQQFLQARLELIAVQNADEPVRKFLGQTGQVRDL
jgi:hypothetical protein